jgi:ribonuclease P protein component
LNNKLSKNQRLKSKKQIDGLFEQGKWIWVSGVRAVFSAKNIDDKSNQKNLLKIGVGVSKKNFKKAVDRNRVKRLLRECYRLQQNIISNEILLEKKTELNLFFLYTDKLLPEYHALYQNITLLLNKVLKAV